MVPDVLFWPLQVLHAHDSQTYTGKTGHVWNKNNYIFKKGASFVLEISFRLLSIPYFTFIKNVLGVVSLVMEVLSGRL